MEVNEGNGRGCGDAQCMRGRRVGLSEGGRVEGGWRRLDGGHGWVRRELQSGDCGKTDCDAKEVWVE